MKYAQYQIFMSSFIAIKQGLDTTYAYTLSLLDTTLDTPEQWMFYTFIMQVKLSVVLLGCCQYIVSIAVGD